MWGRGDGKRLKGEKTITNRFPEEATPPTRTEKESKSIHKKNPHKKQKQKTPSIPSIYPQAPPSPFFPRPPRKTNQTEPKQDQKRPKQNRTVSPSHPLVQTQKLTQWQRQRITHDSL